MTAKRCICKRSASYPLCDGSHLNATWCNPAVAQSPNSIVLYSETLSSFGEWFAANYHHSHAFSRPHSSVIDDVWVLFDGTDLDLLRLTLNRIPHKREYWIHVDHPPHIFETIEPPIERTHYHLEDLDIDTFDLENMQPIDVHSVVQQMIFVSHSIQDEHILLPVLDKLEQQYPIEVFVCAKMPSGVNWYTTIHDALNRCNTVWAFCSEGFRQSTFCAFELGLAQGINKPIVPILLDASSPPLFLQHQNMPSVSRLLLQKPWLSKEQALELICIRELFQEDSLV